MQGSLFPVETSGLEMPEDVVYFEHFLEAEDADRYFCSLLDSVAWAHEELVMYGKRVRMPRLTAWYGDPGAVYVYSGLKNEPMPWNALLLELRTRVGEAAGVQFNSVLLNRYRSGDDGLSWHSDDEPELGPAPVIASLSLGTPRLFAMRRKDDKQRVLELRLAHGSLLIMRGASQRRFQHAVPKEKRVQGERVNLTFRSVVRADE